MDFTVSYQRSREIRKSMIKAYHRCMLGRQIAMPLAFTSCITVVFVLSQGADFDIATVVAFGVPFLIALSIFLIIGRKVKQYMWLQQLEAFEKEPTMEIHVTDSGMALSTQERHWVVKWHKVTHYKEHGGVLLLFAKRVMLADLPLAFFSSEQIGYIMTQLESGGSSTCPVCHKVPASDSAKFGDRLVCADCKDTYVQQLKEGVDEDGQSS